MKGKRLPYGFIFGAATVARLYDEKRYLGFEIETKTDRIFFEISPTGIIETWQTPQRRPRRRL
jgi:hypothetical protein